MESTFKSHTVLFASCCKHDLIKSSTLRLKFVAIIITGNLFHRVFIQRALKSANQSTLISNLVESFCVVWVKVSNFFNVLLSFLFSIHTIRHTTLRNTILVNVYSLKVGLKLKQVFHHSRCARVKLPKAEI